MCQQCLAESLTVLTDDDLGIYIGISRKKYWNIPAGSILIGRRDGPDLIVPFDLFSSAEWDNVCNQKLIPEKSSCSKYLSSDRDILVIVRDNLDVVAKVMAHYDEVFDILSGGYEGDTLDTYDWSAKIITQVYDVFESKGIPTSMNSRLTWVKGITND